tara:strand:+ start:190 stop:495 length:306 start_codon:yes stop_codon:yes gene_type:complete
MAKTKVLSTFTAGFNKNFEQNAGISNIIISNVTTVSVKASVKVTIPDSKAGPESAFIIKDAVIPVGTALLALTNQLIQTADGNIEVSTDTTGGIEVVYTAL